MTNRSLIFQTKDSDRRIPPCSGSLCERAAVVNGRVDGGATGKREYHGKAHEIIPRTGEGSGSLRARLPGFSYPISAGAEGEGAILLKFRL